MGKPIERVTARDIDLGKDGSRWRHGYVPLNAVAVAMKLHRYHGGGASAPAPAHRRERGAAATLAHARLARTGEHFGAGANDLGTRAGQHADAITARSRAAEPAITKAVSREVAQLGGRMEGLDFRFKSPDSLRRKLVTKAAAKAAHSGNSPAAEMDRYAGQVADSLRYTAVFDRGSMVDDTHKLLDGLRARGYTIGGIENTFRRGQSYSGVNMNIIAPNGHTFELQIHTPESISAKNRIHADYETVRNPGASLADRRAAYNRMMAVNSLLKRPEGYERLGEQLFRPNPELHDNSQIRKHRKELVRTRQFPPGKVR